MANAPAPAGNAADIRVAQLRVQPALLLVSFALLTALSARVSVPLPGTDVPVTMQTLLVTLSGALLGPFLGAAAQLTYLTSGALGLPVFALGGGAGYLLGPTGGYLLACPLAAALTGALCGRTSGKTNLLRMAGAMLAANALILLFGWAQLTLLRGDASRAFQMGVLPFLAGDALKVALGALIAWRLRPRTLGLT
jgi:biotin transport system substrate-specific component